MILNHFHFNYFILNIKKSYIFNLNIKKWNYSDFYIEKILLYKLKIFFNYKLAFPLFTTERRFSE